MDAKEVIEVLCGLLTPLIAIIAVYIAYQQWKTNKQRLKAELYDRKFTVYEALMDTIGEVMRNGDISDEQLQNFNIQRRKSHFLFGKNISDFLEEIYDKLVNLQTMNRASTDEKARNAKEKGNIKKGLYDQISIAREKFKEDLSVR